MCVLKLNELTSSSHLFIDGVFVSHHGTNTSLAAYDHIAIHKREVTEDCKEQTCRWWSNRMCVFQCSVRGWNEIGAQRQCLGDQVDQEGSLGCGNSKFWRSTVCEAPLTLRLTVFTEVIDSSLTGITNELPPTEKRYYISMLALFMHYFHTH